MNWIHEYQALVGVVGGIVATYQLIYRPTVKLIEQNTQRIATIESKLMNN